MADSGTITQPNTQPAGREITLRQYFETLLAAEKATREAWSKAHDEALKLHSANLEIHLSALNGEQARLGADRERFLPRETYDVFHSELQKWQDQVTKDLTLITGRDRGIGLSWSVGIAVLGVLIGIGGLAFGLLRYS